MKRKWVMIGATSALGIGMITGGAVFTAQAMSLEDTRGAEVGEPIQIGGKVTQDQVPEPAPEPAKPAPEPTPAQPAPAVNESPVVVSAASPISVQSAVSVASYDSPPSAD